MIKPIVYHSFEEREILERELIAKIPEEKRLATSKALMDIFYHAPRSKRKIKEQKSDRK